MAGFIYVAHRLFAAHDRLLASRLAERITDRIPDAHIFLPFCGAQEDAFADAQKGRILYEEDCLTRIIRKGSDFGSQDGVIVSRTKDRTLPLSSAGHGGRKIGRMARCERSAGQLRRGRSREAR